MTTANDVVDGSTFSINLLSFNPGPDGEISLREALTAANNTVGEDVIFFSSAIDGQPIVLNIGATSEDANADGDLDITDTDGLSIVGNGIGRTIIDGNNSERVFEHLAGDLFMTGLTARNGVDGDAGGIQSGFATPARVSFLRTRWENNIGDDAGGGLYIQGAHTAIDIIDTELVGNHALGSIGAGAYVSADNADLKITGSTFLDNDAGEQGGGAYLKAGSILIEESLFSGNQSNGQGGGLYTTNTGNQTTIRDSVFRMNTGLDGGGAAVTGTNETLTMERCVFDQNMAMDDSGGLHVSTSSGTADISGTTFSSNTAADNGGAISHESGSSSFLTLTNSTISGNRANDSGGGIALDSFDHTLTLNHVTVTLNIADDDGDGTGQGGGLAIIDRDQSVLNIRNSIIQGNDDETPAQTDADDCGNTGTLGTFVSLGGNVFGDGTGCPVGASDTTGAANLLPLSRSETEDFLRLPDTHRLGTGSAAANFASATGVAFDQRAYPRNDGAPDAGAVETQYRLTPTFGTYGDWVTFHGLTPGTDAALFDDPNGDGIPNFQHFAFDQDPNAGGDGGKSSVTIADDGGQDYLTITFATLDPTDFSGTPLQGGVYGIIYTVNGDDDLVGSDLTPVEISPALSAGLPPLNNVGSSSEDWEYHTFRLPSPVGVLSKGFMWVDVVPEARGFETE